jgi:hypothetical protein
MAFAARIPAPSLVVLGRETVFVIAAYLLYSVLRIPIEGSEGQAVDHALHIVSLEQTLGLFHEENLQRAVERQAWLSGTMQWIYLWAYLPILGAAGVIIFVRNHELYRRYRNVMFAAAALGLVIFALVPVAPPRMLPEYGFLDPMHTPFTARSDAKNDFAAVPSYHFGFTLLAAIGVAHACAWRRWVVAIMALFPAVMLVAIVSTANHFFADAAAGGGIVLLLWWLLVYRRERRTALEPAPIARRSLL